MFTDRIKTLLLLSAVVLTVAALANRALGDEEAQDTQRYTFSWPYAKGSEVQPRGGTTRGTAVELASEASKAWQALRASGISDYERDRRAILAMAGPYRASFDFIETVRYTFDQDPPRPYQSWGTEYVYVAEDRGDFISLQHLLVMFTADEDGAISGPFVMKHWRQDWQFEDTMLIEYQGLNEWRQRKVAQDAVRGMWSQAVFQVDDFVRYEALGRWRHEGNYSAWTSEETWRPLPRREYSVRDDYDVLVGINRHTILPNGWTHEQDNRKLALDAPGQARRDTAWIARELGVNRYERIENFDFSAGHAYWQATSAFWGDVRSAWSDWLMDHERLTLRERSGDNIEIEPPYERLFEMADRIAHIGEYDAEEAKASIADIIDSYVVGVDAASR